MVAVRGLSTIRNYITLKLLWLVSLRCPGLSTIRNYITLKLWAKIWELFKLFEYHQKLHHSQTIYLKQILILLFEYHQKLHHSQTLGKNLGTFQAV